MEPELAVWSTLAASVVHGRGREAAPIESPERAVAIPAPSLRTPLRGRLYMGLQRLQGRPLGDFMRRLAALERLEPAELDRLHEQRLRAMLAYARARVPLYRTEPWQRASSNGDDGMPGWPVLERDVLRAHVEELRALPRRPWQVRERTSGSTGAPIRVALTAHAATWQWARRYRSLEWHGVPVGVRALRLLHDRHRLRDLVLGHRTIPALDSPEAFERATRYLLDARPDLVTGTPSALFQLARYLRETGMAGPVVPVARSGGEQLFPFQRAEIETRLARQVVNSYGCNEIGAVAGECPDGSLHVYVEHVHLEIFEGQNPLPAGKFGDIVLTSLANPAMPLVRYRVGDRGRLSSERCSCNLPYPVLVELQARRDDTLLAADGSARHASELVDGLGTFFTDPVSASARQVQFEQVDPLTWRAWVEIAGAPCAAESGDRMLTVMEERLAGIVRRTFGSACRVELRPVAALPRHRGKYRYYRVASQRHGRAGIVAEVDRP